eukprot:Pgem_evm1s10548
MATKNIARRWLALQSQTISPFSSTATTFFTTQKTLHNQQNRYPFHFQCRSYSVINNTHSSHNFNVSIVSNNKCDNILMLLCSKRRYGTTRFTLHNNNKNSSNNNFSNNKNTIVTRKQQYHSDSVKDSNSGKRSPPLKKSSVVIDVGHNNDFEILKSMFKYIWPKDKPGLKARVVFALGCLVTSKVCSL